MWAGARCRSIGSCGLCRHTFRVLLRLARDDNGPSRNRSVGSRDSRVSLAQCNDGGVRLVQRAFEPFVRKAGILAANKHTGRIPGGDTRSNNESNTGGAVQPQRLHFQAAITGATYHLRQYVDVDRWSAAGVHSRSLRASLRLRGFSYRDVHEVARYRKAPKLENTRGEKYDLSPRTGIQPHHLADTVGPTSLQNIDQVPDKKD